MRITIAARLAAVGLAGIVGVGVVGGVSFAVSLSQDHAATLMGRYSTALSRQWNADMMHDGIRATVLASLVARTQAEQESLDTAAIDDQVTQIVTDLDAAAAGAPPSLAAAYTQVRPRVVRYGELARAIVQKANSDPIDARAMLADFLPVFSELEGKLGSIDERLSAAVDEQQAGSAHASQAAHLTIVIVVLVCVLSFAALAYLGARAVVVPVRRMRGTLAQVVAGDLTVRVHSRQSDELGDLGRSVDATLDAVRDAFVVVSACSDEVLGAVGNLNATSREVAVAAAQTSDKATESVTLAGHVSASAQQVADGIEAVSTRAVDIAGSADAASEVGRRAVEGARVASENISRLGDSITQISGVAALIGSIAGQTRLLALNATIEAARAGTAGRGFAVVASEVKDLAQEVGSATDDISTRIGVIQNEVVAAVASIGTVSQVIGEINDHQSTIAVAVERQSRSSAEVAGEIGTASREASSIVGAVGVIAAGAVQTAQSAQRTEQAAGGLAETATRLQGVLTRYRF